MTGNDNPGAEFDITEELASARRQRDAAVTRLRHLETSPSYRIGRAATWLPRALRSFRRSTQTKHQADESRPRRASVDASTPRPVQSWTPMSRVDAPDVSVVIPVYNSARWLEDCLSSVLAQSRTTLEVICVDDGSTDESRSILQRIAERDERVRIFTQPNSGQSVARNRGLTEANGRYVIYLDSDDFWQDDSLWTLVDHADSMDLDLLLFDSVAFRDGDVAASTWERYATYYQRSREYQDLRSGLQMIADMRQRRDYRPHVGLYLARTGFLRDIGARFVPGIVHQDNPYTFSLLLQAQRVAHVRKNFYARRIRPGSTITGLDNFRSAKGYYLSYLAMMREMGSRELAPEVAELVTDVVHGVFRGAQQKFAFLPAEEIDALASLDTGMDARLVMRALQPVHSRPRR